MIKALDKMYIGAQIRINNFFNELKNGEAGVSAIVATVLLILIVVLLASLFWTQISQWFSDTWARITGADTIGK